MTRTAFSGDLKTLRVRRATAVQALAGHEQQLAETRQARDKAEERGNAEAFNAALTKITALEEILDRDRATLEMLTRRVAPLEQGEREDGAKIAALAHAREATEARAAFETRVAALNKHLGREIVALYRDRQHLGDARAAFLADAAVVVPMICTWRSGQEYETDRLAGEALMAELEARGADLSAALYRWPGSVESRVDRNLEGTSVEPWGWLIMQALDGHSRAVIQAEHRQARDAELTGVGSDAGEVSRVD